MEVNTTPKRGGLIVTLKGPFFLSQSPQSSQSLFDLNS